MFKADSPITAISMVTSLLSRRGYMSLWTLCHEVVLCDAEMLKRAILVEAEREGFYLGILNKKDADACVVNKDVIYLRKWVEKHRLVSWLKDSEVIGLDLFSRIYRYGWLWRQNEDMLDFQKIKDHKLAYIIKTSWSCQKPYSEWILFREYYKRLHRLVVGINAVSTVNAAPNAKEAEDLLASAFAEGGKNAIEDKEDTR